MPAPWRTSKRGETYFSSSRTAEPDVRSDRICMSLVRLALYQHQLHTSAVSCLTQRKARQEVGRRAIDGRVTIQRGSPRLSYSTARVPDARPRNTIRTCLEPRNLPTRITTHRYLPNATARCGLRFSNNPQTAAYVRFVSSKLPLNRIQDPSEYPVRRASAAPRIFSMQWGCLSLRHVKSLIDTLDVPRLTRRFETARVPQGGPSVHVSLCGFALSVLISYTNKVARLLRGYLALTSGGNRWQFRSLSGRRFCASEPRKSHACSTQKNADEAPAPPLYVRDRPSPDLSIMTSGHDAAEAASRAVNFFLYFSLWGIFVGRDSKLLHS